MGNANPLAVHKGRVTTTNPMSSSAGTLADADAAAAAEQVQPFGPLILKWFSVGGRREAYVESDRQLSRKRGG